MSTELQPAPRIDPAATNGPLVASPAKDRPQSLAQDMELLANHMAHDSFLPFHLGGMKALPAKVANCLRVIVQARHWNMDPYAVAQNSYVVDGRLEYQGKLVLAVLIKSGVLKGRPTHTFTGEGLDLACTVTATIKGEKEPRSKTLTRRAWQNKNELWGKDPEAKLFYIVVKAWAAQNTPEVFLGIGGADDLEFIPAESVTTEEEEGHENERPVTGGVCLQTQSHTDDKSETDNKTLQEALAEEASKAATSEQLDPDSMLDHQLWSRLLAAFDEFFLAVGVDSTPEGQRTKAETIKTICLKRGAGNLKAMTNAQGEEVLAALTAKTDAARAAKAEAAQKH